MPKATRAVEEILNKHQAQLAEATLTPSSGGVFEVSINGELIFSKKELKRFPEEGELLGLLEAKLA